jgi:hypothetical protein
VLAAKAKLRYHCILQYITGIQYPASFAGEDEMRWNVDSPGYSLRVLTCSCSASERGYGPVACVTTVALHYPRRAPCRSTVF